MDRLSKALLIVLLTATPVFAGKQTVNNGETMGQARTKINSNFTELYDKIGTDVPSGAVFTDDQTASEVSVDTTNLSGVLSATEDTVQKVVDKLDDTTLASFPSDSTHRLVTDTEKATWNGKEDNLGTPSSDGQVLSSTIAGVRSWVDPGSGSMVYPDAGIPNSTGTAWGTSYSLTALAAALGGENWVFTGSVDMTGASSVSLGPLQFADSDGSPSAVGEFRYDNNVTGLSGGALEYHDGTNVKYVVDLSTLPATDGQVISYNASSDKFEMVDQSGGTAGYVTAPTYSDDSCTPGARAISADHLTEYHCTANGDWNTITLTDWSNPSPTTYTLNLSVTGGGTITIDSTGYTSSGSPHAITGQSGTVSMTAAYGSGEDTLTWSGDTVSGTYPNYTIDMASADKTVTAAFSDSPATCSTQSILVEQTTDTDTGANISGDDAEGQGLYFSSAVDIYSVVLKTGNDVYGSSNVSVRIGTSADLSSSYLGESSTVVVSATATEYEFVFSSPVSVSSGTPYYIVWSTTDTSGNYFSLARSASDVYAPSGCTTCYRYDGTSQKYNSSATSQTAQDFFFRVKKCD